MDPRACQSRLFNPPLQGGPRRALQADAARYSRQNSALNRDQRVYSHGIRMPKMEMLAPVCNGYARRVVSIDVG